MQIGIARRDPPAGRAHQEALLDQKGLQYVFDRAPFFANRGGQAVDTDGTAVELLDDRQQQLPVHPLTGVEAETIVNGLIGAPPAIVAQAKPIYE